MISNVVGRSGVRSGSQTFSYTGAQQTFTVPGGVTHIKVRLEGGSYEGINESDDKAGGRIHGTYPVTPGQTLYVNVGQRGIYSRRVGGWNGGADGGTSAGAGGAGATDIRSGGTALANRIAVAGGAGGTSGTANNRASAGGGTTGGTGGSLFGTSGGTGGTQSAGGTGGTDSGATAGSDGSLGSGGAGGAGDAGVDGGGGGGGGYYGGGGGHGTPDFNLARGSGGGGGSGYVGSGTNTANVSGGADTSVGYDGRAIIAWGRNTDADAP